MIVISTFEVFILVLYYKSYHLFALAQRSRNEISFGGVGKSTETCLFGNQTRGM